MKGEAYRVIEQIPIVGENYQTVIDMLKDKYDNPDKITDMHLKAIQALPSVTRINAKDLRNFYENLEKHLRNLEQGDAHFEIRMQHQIKPLMAKLPIAIQKDMITHGGDQTERSINSFRTALHHVIKIQERLQFEDRPKPERRPSLQSAEVKGKGNSGSYDQGNSGNYNNNKSKETQYRESCGNLQTAKTLSLLQRNITRYHVVQKTPIGCRPQKDNGR